MSNSIDSRTDFKREHDASVEPFTDPVAYLAGLGIEAELVETRLVLPEAA